MCVYAFCGNQSINHTILKSLYPAQAETRSSYCRPETLGELQVTVKTPRLYSAIFGSDPASGDGATTDVYKRGKRDFTLSAYERSISFIVLL